MVYGQTLHFNTFQYTVTFLSDSNSCNSPSKKTHFVQMETRCENHPSVAVIKQCAFGTTVDVFQK